MPFEVTTEKPRRALRSSGIFFPLVTRKIPDGTNDNGLHPHGWRGCNPSFIFRWGFRGGLGTWVEIPSEQSGYFNLRSF